MWIGVVVVALSACARGGPPEIELVGIASIPGTATDRSGLTGALEEGTPHNRLGSFGSAIAYTGREHRFVAANDRGPADGASAFRARVQVLDISVDPGRKEAAVKVDVAETILLSAINGEPLVGSIRPRDAGAMRYDAEGICLSPAGTMWLSEEYGPSIDEFSMDGKMVRRLTLPSKFTGAVGNSRATSGRWPNRGLEGLTITKGGRLVSIMQGPLIQDDAADEAGARRGVHNRIIDMNPADGKVREFLYTMASPAMGVSEILAIDEHRFLVLERDGLAGAAARHKALYVIDTSEATDVSGMEAIPKGAEGIVPVTRKKFLDLAEARFGLSGESMPEKFEGLTFGPDLPDGRRLLIVTVDNDMRGEVPSMIYAFAIDPAALPAKSGAAAVPEQGLR